MARDSDQSKRQIPDEVPVASDPIRRALEENQDWYRDLVEHSQDLLCVHDLEGRFLSVNPAPARVLGYSVEEMLRMPMRDFVDPQFRSQFDAYLREIERTGESRGLLAVVTRSGEKRIWEYHNTLRTEGVAAPIVRGMAHDVTERVRAEQALRATNQDLLKTAAERERMLHDLTLFRTLLDQSNDAIQVVDPKTLRFLDVNQRACVELGYSREELLSMTVFDIDPSVDESAVARLQQQFRESGFAIFEGVHRRKDGTTFPVEVNVRSVPLDRDYCVAVARDITERKMVEETIRESELRFRTVYERSPIGIALVDSCSGRFLQVNPKYCEITGRSETELQGSDWESITYPDDIGESREYLRQLAEGKLASHELEKRYLRPDGSVRRVRVLVARMWGEGETRRWHMSLVQDITERRRAEEALKESERRQQLALQIGKIGAFELNLGGGGGTWTAEFAEIWGLPPGFAGDFATLFSWEQVHPEDRARVKAELAQLVQSREEGESEFRVTRPDGVMRWIRGRGQVIVDTATGSLRVVGVNMDITERRQTEEELRQAKERLTEEKLYLEQEINTALGFDEVIGQSKVLKDVMEQAARVAPSNATVLLLGETGTGKELVARAIHRLSLRANNSFIKMNCAAIPSGLLESELFGYEKGAFTGAAGKKAGRVELADKGTLFLDEIGEISLPLQPKLLRLVQDHEFERLGGTHTLKSDFRLIAATNRDLLHSVNEHEFRRDLYYRLNVFPIHVPSLRERRDDIPLLVEHFVRKFARQMKTSVTSIPKTTMDSVMQCNWPGNVRELENFVERSVILTSGSVLVCPLGELRLHREAGMDDTLETLERNRILDALRESHGRLSGPSGAAARLGLKRTTLQSKLKQLGIDHHGYQA